MDHVLLQTLAEAYPQQLGVDEPRSFLPAPLVNGVPKLLFTDDEVAAMFGVSVSTVRNRYNPKSKWYDPQFPVPRSTDGSGKGRKAAVRWHWMDLCIYAAELPPVNPLYKATAYPKPKSRAARKDSWPDIKNGGSTAVSDGKPFEI